MNEGYYGRKNLPELDSWKSDAQHVDAMRKSSFKLLDAIRTGKGEDVFAWVELPTAFVPVDRPSYERGRTYSIIERRNARIGDYQSLYVYREPCTRCGVRADLHAEHGCSRKVAA